VDFNGENLGKVDLSEENLSGVDFNGAIWAEWIFNSSG
jgi:uncharacterized protein YjbI with pentapeptide repeats